MGQADNNKSGADARLAELYRSSARELPSASVDAAILAAARSAVEPGNANDAGGVRRRPRWISPLAAAATLVVGIGLGYRVLDQAGAPDALRQQSPMEMPATTPEQRAAPRTGVQDTEAYDAPAPSNAGEESLESIPESAGRAPQEAMEQSFDDAMLDADESPSNRVTSETATTASDGASGGTLGRAQSAPEMKSEPEPVPAAAAAPKPGAPADDQDLGKRSLTERDKVAREGLERQRRQEEQATPAPPALEKQDRETTEDASTGTSTQNVMLDEAESPERELSPRQDELQPLERKLDPAAWIAEIQAQINLGHLDRARELLDALRHAYPNFVIPAEIIETLEAR